MVHLILLAAEQKGPQAPFWYSMMPVFLILLLGYFLLMRPVQKQEQQRRQMVATLKKNDKIVNSGGIIGVVESIKDNEDEIVLRGGLRILKSSVVRILRDDEKEKDKE
ncbi:MAG: hypothetical protein KatS3mg105_0811 [Gemmatales bacterium]|nr:MAG: hypothetical protein KatS3mg105_0811 [Gemmatales bacterium]